MAKDKDNNGNELSGEDRKLWDFVTRSIRPLDKPRKPAGSRVSPPVREKKTVAEPEKFHLPAWKMPGFGLKPATYDATPSQSETGGGIDRRTSDRLKRGELPIDGRLDLHGLRQGEAQDRLTRFLLESYDSGRRCVLVITGKGNRFSPEQEAGVLRRLLPVWIGMTPLAPLVLLYSKAQPKDGGSGAFYILLRRRR